jgi:NitT/TauT family transport system permease protein
MTARRDLAILAWQIAILIALLAVWQWGYGLRAVPALRPFVPAVLDPYFVSRPSEIFRSFLHLACLADRAGQWLAMPDGITACIAANSNNLWSALAVTLKNTGWGFLAGTLSGIAAGLVLGRSDMLSRIFAPYVVAANSIPRIAIVPLIILMFGLGDMSKVVTAWIVVFFVVFFNTFEGTRAVDRDQVAAARLLGAGEWTILRTVVIPSAMAWVFAALTPAVSFALIGVIVGEFIGAERGIGKLIVEAEARASAAEMMVAIFVLMIVGIILAFAVRRLQAYLLRWQPQFEAQG